MSYSLTFQFNMLLLIQWILVAANVVIVTQSSAAIEYENPIDRMHALEEEISDRMKELDSLIPETIRDEIIALECPGGFWNLSDDAQRWISQNSVLTREVDIKFQRELERYPLLQNAPDLWRMFFETYWRHLKGLPLDFRSQLEDVELYWAESNIPNQNRAPEGGGEIDWAWRLKVNERRHGITHVGVDLATRRFVCYEHGRGLFYPEGNLLERIRGEIVQNPDRLHRPIGGRAIGEWRTDEERNEDDQKQESQGGQETEPL